MEVQQMAAVGRRAFRKNGGVPAAGQQFGDLLVDDAGVAATAPAQENRFILRRQPADDRPAPDLLLGDEGDRHGGVDDQDVDPRHMVGDDQRPRPGMRQVGLQFDAQRPQQGRRPRRAQAQTHPPGTHGKNAQGGQRPAEDQRDEQGDPPGADQEVGFSQSACPR